MITNLPYLKATFIALAPYLTYTYNKYHLQSIMVDQSLYVEGDICYTYTANMELKQ